MGKQIGVVTNYFKQVKAAAIKLSSPLKIGDKIEIKGGKKDVVFIVESMQINRQPIKEAKAGEEVGIIVPEDIHKDYRVFKVS